ncbi:MAG: metallophosphoesterase, partial [Coprobacillaceae bacterium]
MQVMIVSDSHAMEKSTLLNLLKKHPVDYYIHCGDVFMTYDGLPLSNFYIVRGNNDFGDIPFDINITIDQLHFFVTHGHRYYVEHELDSLIAQAKENNADVVCFGHTHRPFVDTIDNILVINPGSTSYPRGSYRNPTYCILDTNTMKTTFYDVKTDSICNPFEKTERKSFSFKD